MFSLKGLYLIYYKPGLGEIKKIPLSIGNFQNNTKKMENKLVTITTLPDEILTIILTKCSYYADIINFGYTCKRFYELVHRTQCIWRVLYRRKFCSDVCRYINEYKNGDWYSAFKIYYSNKKSIYCYLPTMSAKCHNNIKNEVFLDDVRYFFNLALSHNLGYHYTIRILMVFVARSNWQLSQGIVKKPFTFTEIYYAKEIVRYLIHFYLSVKWVTLFRREALTPLKVINFYLQWADTDRFYYDECVENKLAILVKEVESLLCLNFSLNPANIQEKCTRGIITQKDILAAITKVIYDQRRFRLENSINLDSICIEKVLTWNIGHPIAIAIIYQAVAKVFGINCELIALEISNHIFLKWQDDSNPAEKYNINLSTGELLRRQQCPFTRQNENNRNRPYCPELLLRYIDMNLYMEEVTNRQTRNSFHLKSFLSSNQDDFNEYRNLLPFLLRSDRLEVLTSSFSWKYLSDELMAVIHSLTTLNPRPIYDPVNLIVKRRVGFVKYAVGMICYHLQYRYTCVICDWNITGGLEGQVPNESDPIYSVMANDQSVRHVPQGWLMHVDKPSRLLSVEEVIAKDFTHFDGFAYVLNDEKRKEYPEEEAIINTFRTRLQRRS